MLPGVKRSTGSTLFPLDCYQSALINSHNVATTNCGSPSIRTVFWRAVEPLVIMNADLGKCIALARKAITALLALPFSATARIFTASLYSLSPVAMMPIIWSRDELGVTLTNRSIQFSERQIMASRFKTPGTKIQPGKDNG